MPSLIRIKANELLLKEARPIIHRKGAAMSIAKILASVNGRERNDNVLDLAAALARRFGAHIEVLLAQPDPRYIPLMSADPGAVALIEQITQDVVKEAEAAAAKGRHRFEQWRIRHKLPLNDVTGEPSASWCEVIGTDTAILTEAGRLADLVLIGRDTGDTSGPSELMVEAALLQTGRPAILVPPTRIPDRLDRIAIAWNGSAEASRALAFALPILRNAAETMILIVQEKQSTPDGSRIADYLHWHGTKPRIEIITTEAPAGEAILAAAGRGRADLLVMGAYSHSRLRQLVFGGVTSHVLRHANLPVLITH